MPITDDQEEVMATKISQRISPEALERRRAQDREYQKKRYQENPEYYAEYRRNNADKLRQYSKEWYENNKERHNKQTREWHRNNPKRLFVEQLKQSSNCMMCGFSHPAALQFHHRDPSSKVEAVANMLGGKYSLDDIKAEIDKCDLLCANCHAISHFEKRTMKD